MLATALKDQEKVKNLECLGKSSPCCESPLSASCFLCECTHAHMSPGRPLPGSPACPVLAIVILWPGLFESRILDLGKGAALFPRPRLSLCGLPVHTAMQPWQRKQKQMQRNSPAAAALHSHAGGAGQGQSADLGVLSPGGCVCGSETNFKGEL